MNTKSITKALFIGLFSCAALACSGAPSETTSTSTASDEAELQIAPGQAHLSADGASMDLVFANGVVTAHYRLDGREVGTFTVRGQHMVVRDAAGASTTLDVPDDVYQGMQVGDGASSARLHDLFQSAAAANHVDVTSMQRAHGILQGNADLGAKLAAASHAQSYMSVGGMCLFGAAALGAVLGSPLGFGGAIGGAALGFTVGTICCP